MGGRRLEEVLFSSVSSDMVSVDPLGTCSLRNGTRRGTRRQSRGSCVLGSICRQRQRKPPAVVLRRASVGRAS